MLSPKLHSMFPLPPLDQGSCQLYRKRKDLESHDTFRNWDMEGRQVIVGELCHQQKEECGKYNEIRSEEGDDLDADMARSRGIGILTDGGEVVGEVAEPDGFTPVQMETFRQIFDMYDKNGDNVINVEELRGILEILGYSPTPEEVKTILERFDQDKSGTIDFDEYLVLIQHWIEQDEEQIYEAFKVFDKDGDGFVSAQELKRALTQYGEQFTEEEANEFFNMMDTDGDGVINYEEFVEYLRSMQKYSTE